MSYCNCTGRSRLGILRIGSLRSPNLCIRPVAPIELITWGLPVDSAATLPVYAPICLGFHPAFFSCTIISRAFGAFLPKYLVIFLGNSGIV